LGPGVYVHVPFCLRKCPYCDFNSYPLEPGLVEPYIDAVIQEAYRRQDEGPASTAYFGGGTPSCLAPGQLVRLIRGVSELLLPAGGEVTVEVNPGTVDGEKARALRSAGVTRVSVGFQSLDDLVLEGSGRIHSSREALEAFGVLRSQGFEDISVDLMLGLPGQTPESFAGTLRKTVLLGPEHISVYPLKIEEGTPFFIEFSSGNLMLPSEEEVAAMDALLMETLRDHGYERYEISNYCLPGHRCRHNEGYWRNLDYIGLGAGAHSHQGGRRWWNLSLPGEYIDGVCHGRWVEGEESLGPREQMAETVILALRTSEGLDLDAFCRRFGTTLDEVYPQARERLLAQGLVTPDSQRLRLSDKGFDLANRVFIEFI